MRGIRWRLMPLVVAVSLALSGLPAAALTSPDPRPPASPAAQGFSDTPSATGASDPQQDPVAGAAVNPDGTVDVLVQGVELATSAAAHAELNDAIGRPVAIEDRWNRLDTVKVGLHPEELRELAGDPGYRITPDVRLHAAVENAATDLGVRDVATRVPANLRNGAGVTVAVIDTGIDDRHASLSGQVLAGVSMISSPSSGCPTPTPAWRDDEGHGSHVASIVAGKGTPLGVAPAAKLVAIKALECDGSGMLSDIADGIQWAIDHRVTYGIKVINMSLGGDEMGASQDFMEVLVNQAVASGITVVVAAGNSGPAAGTVGTPGAAHHAITIGAIADRGTWRGMPGYLPARFSSRGPTMDGTTKPDLMAPGVAIVAANVLPTYSSPGPTVAMSGTSMATPFAAGVAASLLAAHPELAPSGSLCDPTAPSCPDGVTGVSQPLRTLLRTTARSFGSDPNTTGAGVIDIDRAMAQADGGTSSRSWPTLATTTLWSDLGASIPIKITSGGGELGMSVTCPNTSIRLTTNAQIVTGFDSAGFRFPTTTNGQQITITLQTLSAAGCRVHVSGGTVSATPAIAVSSGSTLQLTEAAPSTGITVTLSDGIPTSATVRLVADAGLSVTPASRSVTAGTWTTPLSFSVRYPEDGVTQLRAQRNLRIEVTGPSGLLSTRTVSVRIQDVAGAPALEWLSRHPGCDCAALVANGATPVGMSADGTKVLLFVDDDDVEPGSFASPMLVLVDRRSGTRTVVSKELDGSLGRAVAGMDSAAISGDGRTIAYVLAATNSGSNTLVVLRDGVRQAVSGPSRWDSIGGIDAQGRNLVALGYPQGKTTPQVYLVDPSLRAWLWSTNAAGVPAAGSFSEPSISADGRSITVSGTWSDLGGPIPAGDVIGVIYLRRDGGPWQIMSRNPDGSYMGQASSSSVNADGTKVAFAGQSGYSPGGDWPLWIRDVATGALTQVTAQNGTSLPMALPERAMFSQDGRYLAFASYEALVPDDVNVTPDVYLYQLATGSRQVASLRSDGSWTAGGTFGSHRPLISADGRTVAFANDTGGSPMFQPGVNGLDPDDNDFNPDAYLVAQSDVAPSGGYVTLTNTKILDTSQPLVGGAMRVAPVTVPTGAAAAAVTVTVSDPVAPGYLVAWSGSSNSPPGTSLVNWDHAGARATVTGVVPVSGGSIKLFANVAVGATVVITGWFGPSGAPLQSITPQRPIDTRITNTPLTAWSFRSFGVSPAAGATGVLATFTVTNTTGPGVLLAGDRFVASWDRAGATVAASAMVPLNGSSLRVLSTSPTQLIVDISGWVGTGSSQLQAQLGRRVFDSRSGLGGLSFFLPPNTATRVNAGGNLPVGASAAVVTLTVVNPVAAGYLALDTGGAVTTSFMAWDRPWSVQSNTVVVPVEADGSFKLRANVPTFVIADVIGSIRSSGCAPSAGTGGPALAC